MESKKGTREIIVSDEFIRQRLDKFLSGVISELSRSKISYLISEGKVTVDGKATKQGYILRGGERVEISIDTEQPKLLPYDFELEILHEDAQILVINKPAGITTHPPNIKYRETVVNALITAGKTLNGGDDILRPGVVHRLDKETSGLMVLAKTQESYISLVNQFKNRTVTKIYKAITWGVMVKDSLTVELPLARAKHDRLKMRVSFTDAKTAKTEISVVRRFANAMFLTVKLFTGRMHQIRVHLEFLGYPIVGDKKYGKKDKYKELLLHAGKLEFSHPLTGELLSFELPIPPRFEAFIQQNK